MIDMNNIKVVRNPKNIRTTLGERGLPSIRDARRRAREATGLIVDAEAE